MSTFFCGITEAVPSLFNGIFSERNSVANPNLDPVVGVLCPVMVQLKNYFTMLRWDALVSQPGPSRKTGCMEQNAERVYNVSDKYYPSTGVQTSTGGGTHPRELSLQAAPRRSTIFTSCRLHPAKRLAEKLCTFSPSPLSVLFHASTYFVSIHFQRGNCGFEIQQRQ